MGPKTEIRAATERRASLSKSVKVIIVEDHEATLRGLQFELSREDDIDVIGTAKTAEEGLALLSSLKPDIVLLDLHLPDSEGPRTLTESFCKGIANEGSSKVIVFSGDNRTAILNIVLDIGVSGFLLKSEPISAVLNAIRSAHAGEKPVVSTELIERRAETKLTPAEQHLLKLLARGMKYQEIAGIRVTAPETVRKQVDQLQDKLSLHSREELIAWAVENGYSQLDISM